MSLPLLLAAESATQTLLKVGVDALAFGSLIALIALGYTMVYGIIGLINFAHGDVFMLGAFLSLTVITAIVPTDVATASAATIAFAILAAMIASSMLCAALNMGIEFAIYRPLRHAPKLVPLVSAIGVSFVLMNVGQLWKGSYPLSVPKLLPKVELGKELGLGIPLQHAVVIGVTIPVMIALTLFVKYARLGKAMRATEQNPVAAQLMGINADLVISITFGIGGALAGLASVIYTLYVGQVDFQMGFKNGLYAFTAAVLGGIGKLPGAVLGGLVIGVVYSFAGYFGLQAWESAIVFSILIVILVFRPTGLLGSTAREKV
jgi:branched-chain amino acid transport system permease protein